VRRVVLIAAATVFAVILSLLSVPAQATWPGRDGRIAFVKAGQIYTIRPDGTGLSKRTYVGRNSQPEWSPSGQRIAYIHEPAAGVREVWMMRADGSGKTRITQGGNATAGPSWSPDGRWLAFAANGILVKVRTTAPFGTPTPILGCFEICEDGAHPVGIDRTLAWSPDGTRIVFAGGSPYSCDLALWILNVATGELTVDRQAVGSGCGPINLIWSDLVWGPAGQLGFGVQVLGYDGPDDSTVVYANIEYPGFYSPIIKTPYDGYADDLSLAAVRGDKSPAPSPSGRYMAFVNDTSGISKIYVAKADGSSRRQLTYGSQPDWQRLS
jgi:dipeptidyl aminopeptidase/acylaminoacyl peptidase